MPMLYIVLLALALISGPPEASAIENTEAYTANGPLVQCSGVAHLQNLVANNTIEMTTDELIAKVNQGDSTALCELEVYVYTFDSFEPEWTVVVEELPLAVLPVTILGTLNVETGEEELFAEPQAAHALFIADEIEVHKLMVELLNSLDDELEFAPE